MVLKCLGAIAQLGERVLCKHEVVGSIPSGSTNLISSLFAQAFKRACAGENTSCSWDGPECGMQEKKTMAVPKSKISKSKRDMRRAHDSLKSDAYVEDKVTGELHRPHHIDLKTGMYGGKQILKVKDRF